ncbi:hypothetical protein PSPO01_16370 [Paraphaeosphaeria sporulosa]
MLHSSRPTYWSPQTTSGQSKDRLVRRKAHSYPTHIRGLSSSFYLCLRSATRVALGSS